MTSLVWVMSILAGLMPAQGGGSGGGSTDSSEGSATHQQVDSLLLVRHAGHWEETRPRDDRTYEYRVVVKHPGSLRFEVPGDEGPVTRALQVDADAVRTLLGSAGAIDLDGLPESLMAAPWCPVVRTDAPSVTIAVFSGGREQRVTDYHGCTVEGDRSDDRLIGALRELQRTATEVFGLEERFQAAPLAGPAG